jgi:hypothetical protein
MHQDRHLAHRCLAKLQDMKTEGMEIGLVHSIAMDMDTSYKITSAAEPMAALILMTREDAFRCVCMLEVKLINPAATGMEADELLQLAIVATKDWWRTLA